MQFAPRYDGQAVIDVTPFVRDPASAVIRQRDRLAGELSEISPGEWATPSRCAGWSVQDVVEHLAGVNQFWLLSIRAGLGGEPTRLLASFDPVAVPAAMVEAARGAPPAASLEKLSASNAELATLVRSLSDRERAMPAEAPPGHIAIGAVCAHALWDAWIHERDVLLPLGRHQQIEPDEVAIAMAYVAALGPAFYVNAGMARPGSLSVQAKDPNQTFIVDVGDRVCVRAGDGAEATVVVEGDAVALVEALSCRLPQPAVIDEHRWLVDGLRRAFGSVN